MKETFFRTMAACVAIAVLGGAGYVVGSGITSISESSIRAVVSNIETQRLALQRAEDAIESTSETLLQGLRRFGGLKTPK